MSDENHRLSNMSLVPRISSLLAENQGEMKMTRTFAFQAPCSVSDYTVRAFMAVEEKRLKIVHLNKTVDTLDIKIIVIN